MTMEEFHIIIPARYHSTRLPGKPLLQIANKSMLQHVHENAIASGAESVTIATEDERIAEAAEAFGANVCMTSDEHASGTERITEALLALDLDEDPIIINLQGDEPLIKPELIHQVVTDLAKYDNVKVATPCCPITDVEELFNPHVVKVVMNKRNFALYFSRAPIPWNLNTFQEKSSINLNNNYFQHIGLYGYRASFLKDHMDWCSSPLQPIESLEQLSILWGGGRIHMVPVDGQPPISVDTQADLKRVQSLFDEK